MTTSLTQLEIILAEAAEIAAADERKAYLDRACTGDAALRQEVEALLRNHFAAGKFLNSSPAELTCPIPEAGPERPGSEIGPYKLLQVIGEGGMGVVFMAEQTVPVERRVALKIIKPGMDTRQVIARFEAERQALAMMEHPHIAKVLDAGATDSGRPYFVMELVRGIPITKYCDEHRLTLKQRLELFLPVCQAVQHAHQKGIIHRDLKPSNVLVAQCDDQPIPKVIDFGVAKAAKKLTDRTMFTEFGQVVGTLEYMSPEQAKFNQLDIDTRSDIYSLGVLLYELLSGSTPFDRKRLQSAAFDEMLRIIREEEPPRPSMRLSTSETLPSIAANRNVEPTRLNRSLQGELDWIVMKSLEKDRNRRYETASGFARDIEHYLHDEPVQACPPSTRYRLRKFARRNKVTLITGGLIGLSLIAGTVVSVWQAVRATEAEQLAQTRFEAEKDARTRAETESAKAGAVSDLLQEMLSSASPDKARGADYTVRQLLNDASRRLAGQLEHQPEVEAAVRAAIGNAYRRLVLPKEAEPHLRRALAIRRTLPADQKNVLAQSLLDYGWVLSDLGRTADCERHVREALAIYKADSSQVDKTIEALALLQLCLAIERPDDSATLANEAIALGHKHFPHGSGEIATVLHRLADANYRSGDFAAAKALALEALAMHERWHGERHLETAWCLTILTRIHLNLREYAPAEKTAKRALRLFTELYGDGSGYAFEALNYLEQALSAKGDQEALAALHADRAIRQTRALARQPGDPEILIPLADTLYQAGTHAAALTLYSEVVARRPDLFEGWHHRGRCYLARRDFAEAYDDFTKAIELKRDSWQPWSDRAFASFHLEKWDEAVADFSKAIELSPEFHTNWFHRGHAYLRLQQWDKAAADFTRVVESWPEEPGGWHLRALAYAQSNQSNKAVSDLRQAIAKGFRDVEHLKNEPRFESLRARDDFQELIVELESKK
jgi:serine/threonine protein kinase/tetratricopeptide (TPR) repeat protein